jgi:threonine/homoserine/homoserine lactone efflux protein
MELLPMPDPATWLAFALAAGVLLIIPGPTVLLVISYAISHGRRSAWATVPGVALGDFTAMTASLLGLGAVLAASAELFSVLKWIGAAYLIYLGIKTWRAKPAAAQTDEVAAKPRLSITGHAYVVTALNPKSIAFYVAFLPQFVDPGRPAWPQLVALGATFLLLATINAASYAVLAGQAQHWFRGYRARKRLNRVSGALLIGCGGLVGSMRQGS